MRGSEIAKPLFLTATLVLFGVSGFLAMKTHYFVVHAARAEGRVVEMLNETAKEGGNPLLRPVVEFETDRGIKIRFSSSSATYPPSYERDDIVTVLYEPLRPRSAEIDGIFPLWGAALITGGLCVIFAGFTIAFYLRIGFADRKVPRRKAPQAKQ